MQVFPIFCHLQGLTTESELLWYAKLKSSLLMYFWEKVLEKWLIYTQEGKMHVSKSLFDLSEDARVKGRQ